MIIYVGYIWMRVVSSWWSDDWEIVIINKEALFCSIGRYGQSINWGFLVPSSMNLRLEDCQYLMSWIYSNSLVIYELQIRKIEDIGLAWIWREPPLACSYYFVFLLRMPMLHRSDQYLGIWVLIYRFEGMMIVSPHANWGELTCGYRDISRPVYLMGSWETLFR